jgi:REP element-mobilizing transposase RayT
LRDRTNARIVGDALQHFDGVRYDLDSFVVMPNHVHLLVQFRATFTLKAQSESWLRYSARKITNAWGDAARSGRRNRSTISSEVPTSLSTSSAICPKTLKKQT